MSAVALLATAVLLTAAPSTPAPSTPAATTAPSDADRAAITQAALDYIESWYEGNPERMERALHPDLAKRIVHVAPDGRGRVEHMGALALVQGVRGGYGKNTPIEKQQKDITILDVYGNAASVKLVASDWIDYLHLGKVNGRWVIVNVLWELKPEAAAARGAGAAKPEKK